MTRCQGQSGRGMANLKACTHSLDLFILWFLLQALYLLICVLYVIYQYRVFASWYSSKNEVNEQSCLVAWVYWNKPKWDSRNSKRRICEHIYVYICIRSDGDALDLPFSSKYQIPVTQGTYTVFRADGHHIKKVCLSLLEGRIINCGRNATYVPRWDRNGWRRTDLLPM